MVKANDPSDTARASKATQSLESNIPWLPIRRVLENHVAAPTVCQPSSYGGRRCARRTLELGVRGSSFKRNNNGCRTERAFTLSLSCHPLIAQIRQERDQQPNCRQQRT